MASPTGKSRWKSLVKTSAWVCSIFAVFVFPPPKDLTSDANGTFAAVAGFVVAVLIGLLAIPIKSLGYKRHSLIWGGICVLLLGIGLSSLLKYDGERSSLSATYLKERVVIGTQLTANGTIHVKEEPGITNEQLLMDCLGHPEQVWDAGTIRNASRVLRIWYLLTVTALSGCVMTLLQAIACLEKRS
jgi:hypothetical protein